MMTSSRLHRDPFPLCFSSAFQYRAWKQATRQLSPGASKYCADCTPEYQGEMIRKRRCAYPGTTFHIAEDGQLDGVRPGCRLPNHKKKRKGA